MQKPLTPLARTSRGFTLMEMMLVIAIAALILGFGVPNLRSFILNARMTASANDILMAVHTARSEAIKRQRRTVVCLTKTPEADDPDCDGDGSEGWAVFVDEDDDGVADSGEPIVLRHSALHPSLSIEVLPADHNSYIAFEPNGFAIPISGQTPFNLALLCDNRGNRAIAGDDYSAARALVVSATGRPQVTRSVTEIEDLGGC